MTPVDRSAAFPASARESAARAAAEREPPARPADELAARQSLRDPARHLVRAVECLGLIAGYYRGLAELVISRLGDICMAFPPVLFAILLIAVLGTGLTSIIVAIVVIDWTRFSRVVRAEAMSQGAMDYVASAQVAGRSRLGIALAEILPNVLPTIVALLTLEMGIAVIVEAILSFVNLSISTDQPTWGGMIAEGRTSIYQAWWVLVFPLAALFLTVLSFSQLGEGLKDYFDPVLR